MLGALDQCKVQSPLQARDLAFDRFFHDIVQHGGKMHPCIDVILGDGKQFGEHLARFWGMDDQWEWEARGSVVEPATTVTSCPCR